MNVTVVDRGSPEAKQPKEILALQGDPSGCSVGVVDIKTKVVF